ncbi:MAG: radical SAM protein [Chloroflexi bacterium]|nr:radical SAM protein [Chloroflexota bacterium]
MKVLLIQPPHDFCGTGRPPAFFPSGLGYIAQQILSAGHEVQVLEIWANGLIQDRVLEEIDKAKYDLVGISAHSSQYAYVKWLSAELKKRSSSPVILGGALATLTPEIVLEHSCVDICVVSEGEETVTELLEKPDSLDKTAGIYFKDAAGKIRKGPVRAYTKDLDATPFPAWDFFPMDVYLANCTVPGQSHLKAINVIAGRGCPYSCHFCSKTFTGARFRSVDNIMKEVLALKEKYGIKGLFFADELLLINKRRVYELCEAIEPLGLKWYCQGRVNLVDYELLKRMKKAGCVSVGYGVESGSQTILDNMKKETTVEQGIQALKVTAKVGLRAVVQMMYAYPGENQRTVQETVDFFKKAPHAGWMAFSITTPLPGTQLWQDAIDKGIISNEESFLERMAGGHNPRAEHANLSDLTEDEFAPLLRRAQNQILVNSILRHPLLSMRYTFSDTVHYVRRFGAKKTLGAVWDRITILFPKLRIRRRGSEESCSLPVPVKIKEDNRS